MLFDNARSAAEIVADSSKIIPISQGCSSCNVIVWVSPGIKDIKVKEPLKEEIIKGFSKENSRVKFISFSKNFGKEAAMYAGLQHSSGDYVTIMDCDLQDPPELLPEISMLYHL